ncbi:MAG TPA: sodium/proline symporter [Candidatus Babeliales bacterium]|nr:sodium/proline symporter [Candidatus Babeliales bacterium]
MEIQILLAFILYFCVLTLIGLYVYSKNQSASAYLVGDRSVNYWVTAIATQATDMGIWLFLGFPAQVYLNGVPELWTAIGLVTGMLVNWHFIAPRLRRETEKHNAHTVASYLEKHYNDRSGIIRLLTGIIMLVFFTIYISAALMGMGELFASAFGITYHVGIFLGLAAAIIYTLLGGFVAIAWCDFFQGIFLLIMIVLVPAYAFFHIGGAHAIVTAAQEKNISLSLFSSWYDLGKGLLLAAGWGLAYPGLPHILLNFMGIDKPENLRRATYIGITWQIIVLLAATSAGLIAIPYFGATLAAPETLFILMAKQLFFPFLVGLVLCGVFAATLSTLDSHILISGSVIAQDIYKYSINPQAHSKAILKLSRISSIIVSLLAILLVYHKNSSIYSLVNYAWSGLGSAFAPLMIMTLYYKNTTRAGAIAGIITGATVSAVWPSINSYILPSITILPLVTGFFSSLFIIFAVSAITKKQ